MANYCKDCVYVNRENGFIGYVYFCGLMTNSAGNYVKVSENGTCARFHAKNTKENMGYKGESGGCFLTSACVDYMGKADDCYELTTLRAFRDTYMQETEERRLLIQEYYEIAPQIINRIQKLDNQNIYYNEIYKTVLVCLKLIEQKRYEETKITYVKMVEKLKKELMGGEKNCL